MAIVHDAASFGSGINVSSINWSHTIGGGTNRLLVVGVSTFDAFGGGVVTGVTYNGVPMIAGPSIAQVVSATLRATLWYLLGASLPVAGAYSVVASFSGPGFTQAVGGAESVTGAAQAAPEATATGSSALPSSSYSTNLTTVSSNAWVFNDVCAGSPSLVNPGGTLVERWDCVCGTVTGGSGNTLAAGPPGVKTMLGTFVTAPVGGWAHALAAWAEAAAPVADVNTFFGRTP
jgi:hypothetical protein